MEQNKTYTITSKTKETTPTKGIALDNVWYSLAPNPAKYFKLFNKGDTVEAKVDDKQKLIVYIRKIEGQPTVVPGSSIPEINDGLPKEAFNGAEFGLACKLALKLLLKKDKDKLKEATVDGIMDNYGVFVKSFWQKNKALRKELE